MFLDRTHLRLLIDLDRTGSLSRAAETQRITQSAASQRLHEAERRLGLSLTQKTGRSLALTAAGRHLVNKASEAERMLRDAESEAQWIARSGGTKWRLIVSIFDRMDFATLSRELEAKGVSLSVLCRPTDHVAALLKDGAADAALMLGPTRPPGRAVMPVAADRLVAICGTYHPLAGRKSVSAKDISCHRYFTYSERPDAGFEYTQFFRPAGALPERVERFESVSLIIDMVSAGLGLSILPMRAVALDAAAERIGVLDLPTRISVSWWLSSNPVCSSPLAPEDAASSVANALPLGRVSRTEPS